jgi:hypothetical protein
LGVVRQAFTPHDEEPEPLSASVGTLPDGTVVVGSRASEPKSRLIVDEYKLHPETSEYRLRRVGTDLFRSVVVIASRLLLYRGFWTGLVSFGGGGGCTCTHLGGGGGVFAQIGRQSWFTHAHEAWAGESPTAQSSHE